MTAVRGRASPCQATATPSLHYASSVLRVRASGGYLLGGQETTAGLLPRSLLGLGRYWPATFESVISLGDCTRTREPRSAKGIRWVGELAATPSPYRYVRARWVAVEFARSQSSRGQREAQRIARGVDQGNQPSPAWPFGQCAVLPVPSCTPNVSHKLRADLARPWRGQGGAAGPEPRVAVRPLRPWRVKPPGPCQVGSSASCVS